MYSNKLTDLLIFTKTACHTSVVQESAQLTDLLKLAHPATNLNFDMAHTFKHRKETDSLVGPGTTSCHFHERITMPDALSLSLHHGLSTEGASICGMLADFNFLQHFPEGGTIMSPIFIDSSDLLVVLIMSSHKH